MTPSPRAALVAAAAVVGAVLLPGPLVLLLLLVLAGAIAGDALAVRRPPVVERSIPATLARGVAAPLVVRLLGERRGRVRVRQPSTPSLVVEPRDGDGGLDAVVTPRHRGAHVLPPLALRSTGPLGLGRWDHAVAGELEVLVYPDLPAARALSAVVKGGLARDLAQLTRGALGLGTELERVRDYLPDDELRQVNWRATARMGRPMSNEYRLDEDRDVVCVVDAGRLMGAPVSGDRTRLDVALDAAAAVSLVADAVGDRCGTIAFDDRIRRLVRPRRRGARAVIDALFDLEPSAIDAAYDLAFNAVGTGKRSCIVALTDLVDEAAARSLVDAAPVVARRHVLIVASALDDDLTALLRQVPSSVEAVHAAAVAADVLEARRAAAARLRAAGATVVEAPPSSLGRACVAAYLRQKARARF